MLREDVVYGKGSDAQIAAAIILKHLEQHGYMCSLDYTKCFDLLRPGAIVNNFCVLPGAAPACLLHVEKCGPIMSDGHPGMDFLIVIPSIPRAYSYPKDPKVICLAPCWRRF